MGGRFEVKVFVLANGKNMGKVNAQPQTVFKLLRARLFPHAPKGAAGVVPPFMHLSWDLTKAGQAERRRLKPTF
ncbi:hypothetical protein HYH02_001863 [Chlamydomonas schloesseri]|uniref:Uncharacterized protein n=1 Tax=Chlamydomonas schloesseri TaxID=2026947 RepID=A0A836BCA1_9CHLO|nr:hypothetical protein HYH02_001863 [Chlamydomonas schloesseri]|eukprot:KAG2453650.1 hypothetical protein HYH02_001863 [Chlamydomonas schloesseri]